jgi:hypothetical protein
VHRDPLDHGSGGGETRRDPIVAGAGRAGNAVLTVENTGEKLTPQLVETIAEPSAVSASWCNCRRRRSCVRANDRT